MLRRGGLPLDPRQRAGLMVARAMLGSPALLLLNDIDGHLEEKARAELETMLQNYRGVVVVASESGWCAGYREWDLEAAPPAPGRSRSFSAVAR